MSLVTHPSESELWDPFAASADPAAYLPRVATERALAGLEEAFLGGASTSLLVGEPGLGKSLLLRVLEQRLAPRRVTALLPYPALPLGDLCGWAATLLGLPPANDPAASLLDRARSGASPRDDPQSSAVGLPWSARAQGRSRATATPSPQKSTSGCPRSKPTGKTT